MKNGRDDHDEPPNDPKITRIEDARRRRRMGIKDGNEGSGGRGGRLGGGLGNLGSRGGRKSGTVKEWIFGGVIIAMAIGFVISVSMPLIRWAMTLAN